MKRLWPWFLLLITMTVSLLFLSGFLTGAVHHELQDPYSRATRVLGSRFGVRYDRIVPNEMSEYYFGELKQPRVFHWAASDNSYRIEKLSGDMNFEAAPIAPIMFLKPLHAEIEFLRHLPDNRTRLAVIRSLYQPRKNETNRQDSAWNRRLTENERARIDRILSWYEFERKDFSIPFKAWWRDNAKVFGLRKDGSPFPLSQSAPPGDSAPVPPDTQDLQAGI